jgi:hypothetical protein
MTSLPWLQLGAMPGTAARRAQQTTHLAGTRIQSINLFIVKLQNNYYQHNKIHLLI